MTAHFNIIARAQGGVKFRPFWG